MNACIGIVNDKCCVIYFCLVYIEFGKVKFRGSEKVCLVSKVSMHAVFLSYFVLYSSYKSLSLSP